MLLLEKRVINYLSQGDRKNMLAAYADIHTRNRRENPSGTLQAPRPESLRRMRDEQLDDCAGLRCSSTDGRTRTSQSDESGVALCGGKLQHMRQYFAAKYGTTRIKRPATRDEGESDAVLAWKKIKRHYPTSSQRGSLRSLLSSEGGR